MKRHFKGRTQLHLECLEMKQTIPRADQYLVVEDRWRKCVGSRILKNNNNNLKRNRNPRACEQLSGYTACCPSLMARGQSLGCIGRKEETRLSCILTSRWVWWWSPLLCAYKCFVYTMKYTIKRKEKELPNIPVICYRHTLYCGLFNFLVRSKADTLQEAGSSIKRT